MTSSCRKFIASAESAHQQRLQGSLAALVSGQRRDHEAALQKAKEIHDASLLKVQAELQRESSEKSRIESQLQSALTNSSNLTQQLKDAKENQSNCEWMAYHADWSRLAPVVAEVAELASVVKAELSDICNAEQRLKQFALSEAQALSTCPLDEQQLVVSRGITLCADVVAIRTAIDNAMPDGAAADIVTELAQRRDHIVEELTRNSTAAPGHSVLELAIASQTNCPSPFESFLESIKEAEGPLKVFFRTDIVLLTLGYRLCDPICKLNCLTRERQAIPMKYHSSPCNALLSTLHALNWKPSRSLRQRRRR